MRVFEDFVPVSEDEALVTGGRELVALDTLKRCPYTVDAHGAVTVALNEGYVEVAQGRDLRLGHWLPSLTLPKGGTLVYSRARYPGLPSVVGAKVRSLTAHQPFVYAGAVYYTDDWPEVRIYRQRPGAIPEERLVMGHWPNKRGALYCQVGNPHWDTVRDTMYFEARIDPAPDRPDLWEVWSLKDGVRQFITSGANPAVYADHLYWGEWNGRGFSYHRTAL